jgi:FkbM family methyltransferase
MNTTLFDLAQLVFVDCGASYFPPDTWQLALSTPQSHLILVDPNGDNLSYASQIRARTSVIPRALSRRAVLETLYIANTDSGSSLLPPIGRPKALHSNPGYFLPIRAKNMVTSTLTQELDTLDIATVDCIKLDTQGTELAILQGLESSRLDDLLFIEAEVSLQNPPIHKGAASLLGFASFLEPQGFELANLRLSRPNTSIDHCLARPNECDILYVRPLQLLGDRNKSPSILAKLLILSNLYYLYDYADEIVEHLLSAQLFSPDQLQSILQSQQDIRDCQNHLLANGALSLWHRDSA